MEVIKANGKTQDFDVSKVERAINLANNTVEESARMSNDTTGISEPAARAGNGTSKTVSHKAAFYCGRYVFIFRYTKHR